MPRIRLPRVRRQRSARPPDTVEPPSTAELLIGVVVVTLLVMALGSVANSVVWLVGFMVFLPGAASALCTVRQTVMVCVWTTFVVAVVVLVPVDGAATGLDRVLIVLITVCLGVASVYACHRRIWREREMLRLRSVAGAMQRQILVPLPFGTADVVVDGLYEPLQEDRLVGGDVYDVVESPWGTRVLIGDVQGKGLPAVGAAFAVIGAFRAAARRDRELTAVVDFLDASVTWHNVRAERAGDDERFVTALVVDIGPRGDARAVNCGHVPPYLLHGGAVTEPRLTSGLPLGLTSLTDEPVTVDAFPFPPGAVLLLSTDGLMETRAADGTFYPVERELSRRARLLPDLLPAALCADARAFAGGGGQQDDVAVLTVHRAPRPT
ncbi:PP2C family protein-serine/threonine phosphatase [Streptomyces sp. NPDC017979]|uniref:PP2C family protein-serine/threonine phosphatase n=1 Tax=Streptomyces sp. NPDC017979 TaxID=3365024 RepID=UPI0037B2EA19